MSILQSWSLQQLREREKYLRAKILTLSYTPAEQRPKHALGDARTELSAIVIELGNRGEQPEYL